MGNDTPVAGRRLLDLRFPENAFLNLTVHSLTWEQFEGLVEGARENDLPVRAGEAEGVRWVEIWSPGACMTVFCPNYGFRKFIGAETFDEFIDRKMKDRKFIEVAA